MASFKQNLIFGEFDDLSPEEHAWVFQILHGGLKEGITPKVEFPWDAASEELPGAVQGSKVPMHSWAGQVLDYSCKKDAEYIDNQQLHGSVEMDCNSFSFIGHPSSLEHAEQFYAQKDYELRQYVQNSAHFKMQVTDDHDEENQVSNQSKLKASLKPYERRNKKKRPPGYYSRLGNEQCRDQLGSFENVANELSQQNLHAGYRTGMDYQQVQYQNIFPSYCDYSMGRPVNNISHTNYRGQTEVPHSNHNRNINQVSGNNFEGVNANVQFPIGPLAYQSHVHHSIPQQCELGYVDSMEIGRNEDQHIDDLYEVVDSYHQVNVHIPALSDTSERQDHVCSSSDAKLVSNSNQNNPIFQAPINSLNNIQDSGLQSVVDVEHQITVLSNVLVAPAVELPSQNKEGLEMQKDVHLTKMETCSENVSSESGQPDSKFSNTQAVHKAEIIENVKQKPISWAGLFKSVPLLNQSTSIVRNVQRSVVNKASPCEQKSVKESSLHAVPAAEDSAAKELGEHISQMAISHGSVLIQPRGLVNKANWCFINGTLQALSACPPFYNLLKRLPRYPSLQKGPTSTPILDAMIEFIHEFQPLSHSIDKGQTYVKDMTPGIPFEPTYVYKMLQALAVNSHFKLGRQEDAEEFLSCILDGMHEEMSAAVSMNNSITNTDGVRDGYTNGFVLGEGEDVEEIQDEEDSWKQVRPKKKSVLTRRSKIAKTPIADIFSGMLRSAVYKSSAKETATIEPFFTLKLDIQSDKVKSVQDALQGLVSNEHIEGYSSSNTKVAIRKLQVDLSKKLSLEELPPVLILHLKSFVYNQDGGSQKLVKKVDFSVDLEITKDLLSPNARNKLGIQQRSYKLFAVVYHHGKKATGGHYTTTVFHVGINVWVHIDDSNIKTVHVSQVLKYMPPRVPYLLYYRRLDSH